MTSARQQVLVLHLTDGDLGSTTVAWAFYDGTLSADDVQMQAGSENEPPYSSVLDAMRCLLYTSPSPRDATLSRMPSSA